MQLAFDHIIHYTANLDEVSKNISQIGLNNSFGGEHIHGGTWNRLTHFGIDYIEFLGIKDEQKFKINIKNNSNFSPLSLMNDNENKTGFIKIALRSYNLDELKVELENKGILTDGPFEKGRKTQSGEQVNWKILYAGHGDCELALPFFIDWCISDQERIKYLKNSNLISESQGRNITLSSIVFAVTDFQKSYELWREWFKLEVCEAGLLEDLKAEYKSLKINDLKLIFAKPIEDGIVQEVINKRGPSPFLLQLVGANKPSLNIIENGYYQFL